MSYFRNRHTCTFTYTQVCANESKHMYILSQTGRVSCEIPFVFNQYLMGVHNQCEPCITNIVFFQRNIQYVLITQLLNNENERTLIKHYR